MLTGETPVTVDDDEVRPWEYVEDPESAVAAEAAILADTPRPSRATRTRRPASDNPLAGRAARASTNKNVTLATLTGVLIAAVVVIVFLMGTIPVMVLVCLALLMATAEAFAAFRSAGAHPATLLGLLATLALAIGAYNKGEAAIGLVTVLFVFFAVLWYLGAEREVDMLDGIGATVFVYVWLAIFGSYAALLVSPVNYPDDHGLAFLIGAIIVVVANDVGALFHRPVLRQAPPRQIHLSRQDH